MKHLSSRSFACFYLLTKSAVSCAAPTPPVTPVYSPAKAGCEVSRLYMGYKYGYKNAANKLAMEVRNYAPNYGSPTILAMVANEYLPVVPIDFTVSNAPLTATPYPGVLGLQEADFGTSAGFTGRASNYQLSTNPSALVYCGSDGTGKGYSGNCATTGVGFSLLQFNTAAFATPPAKLPDYFKKRILMHELGHTLGMWHPGCLQSSTGPASGVMTNGGCCAEPNGLITTLQPFDKDLLNSMYR